MTRFMLDTNAVSVAVHRRSAVFDRKLGDVGGAAISISAITYGEIIFGLEWKPEAGRLAKSMSDFLLEISVMPWTDETAQVYGTLRAGLRRSGKTLAPLDMLIAAHALEVGATLVTSDRAFRYVPGLTVEDWTDA